MTTVHSINPGVKKTVFSVLSIRTVRIVVYFPSCTVDVTATATRAPRPPEARYKADKHVPCASRSVGQRTLTTSAKESGHRTKCKLSYGKPFWCVECGGVHLGSACCVAATSSTATGAMREQTSQAVSTCKLDRPTPPLRLPSCPIPPLLRASRASCMVLRDGTHIDIGL